MATGKDLKEIKRGRARTWLMRALAVSMSLLALELGFRGFLFATGSTYSAQAVIQKPRELSIECALTTQGFETDEGVEHAAEALIVDLNIL